MKNLFTKIICFIGIFAFTTVISMVSVYALEDGAYIVTASTSYVNPDSGESSDSGSNTALGESMCESITSDTALVEIVGDKTYVTIGLGLMSNISSVAINVQTESGEYENREITHTGTTTEMDDDCYHYRFEVDSADLYIMPQLYVDPMGREVEYYIILDTESAVAGTGDYLSEMVNSEAITDESEVPNSEPFVQSPDVDETSEAESESPDIDDADDTEIEAIEDSSSKDGEILPIILIIAAVVVIGAVIVVVVKRTKKNGK